MNGTNGIHATTTYKMLLPYLKKAEASPDWYCRFTSGAYVPLIVEYSGGLDYFGDEIYIITHYVRQGDDMLKDPQMWFSVNHKTKTVRPLRYHNDIAFGYTQEVFWSARLHNPKALREQDDFLWTWAKNIKAQGFTPERYEYGEIYS